MFWKESNWQVIFSFVIAVVMSLLMKDRSLVLSLGLGFFAIISQNVILLRKNNNISFRMYWQPLSQYNALETYVYGWTYINLLCLVTGTLAKMNHIETWLGFSRALYLAFLLLALGFLIRAWFVLLFHGSEKAMEDFIFFFLACVPVIGLEIFFGGFQFFGVPQDLVTARIAGEGSPWWRVGQHVVYGISGGVGTVFATKLMELALEKKEKADLADCKEKIETVGLKLENLDKTFQEQQAQIDRFKKDLHRSDASGIPSETASTSRTPSVQEVLDAVKKPVDYGFAIKGLPQSGDSEEVSEASGQVTANQTPLVEQNPEEEERHEEPQVNAETVAEVETSDVVDSKSVVSDVLSNILEQVKDVLDDDKDSSFFHFIIFFVKTLSTQVTKRSVRVEEKWQRFLDNSEVIMHE